MNWRGVAGFSVSGVWFRRRLQKTLAGQAPSSGSGYCMRSAPRASILGMTRIQPVANDQLAQRAARKSSVTARTERRAQRLDSRPSSQNGSRCPDRRIWGEMGSTPCAPTLWKEDIVGPFSTTDQYRYDNQTSNGAYSPPFRSPRSVLTIETLRPAAARAPRHSARR